MKIEGNSTDPREGQDQDVSLNAALAATFDALESAEEGEEETAAPEETSEAEAQPEDGEEAPEVEASEEEDDGEEAVIEEDEPDYDEPPPARWPRELKEAYAQLSPGMKKTFMERLFKPMQKTYTESTMELSKAREELGPIAEMYQQHREEFQRMGVDPATAVQQQIAWAAHFARVGPEQGISDMRKAFRLEGDDGQEVSDEYLTPSERALKQRLDALEQRTSREQQQSQQTQQQERQHAAQQAMAQEAQEGLRSFVSETNEDGKPAHPHVQELAPEIAGIIRGGLVKRVDDFGQRVPARDVVAQAYKMAVQMNPKFRRATQNNGQVGRAKAAQKVGVVTKEPSPKPGPASSDVPLTATINDVYDQLDRKAG